VEKDSWKSAPLEFDFETFQAEPPEAKNRKIIYTINFIEGFHRQLRKVTKTKGAFPW